jgi:hypothetical protein
MSTTTKTRRANRTARHCTPAEVEYRGLCPYCSSSATCTFPRDPAKPLLQCDEFQSETRPSGAVTSLAKDVSFVRRETPPDSAPQGLCRTCAMQAECTFPKAAGGVWRCEEFQ